MQIYNFYTKTRSKDELFLHQNKIIVRFHSEIFLVMFSEKTLQFHEMRSAILNLLAAQLAFDKRITAIRKMQI